MTALHDPLYLTAGDTWRIDGELKFSDDGSALDLTNASITWWLNSIDGAINHITLDTSSDGGIVIDTPATGGLILITVSAAETAELAPGVYKDWLRVTLPNGSKLTEWNGFVSVGVDPGAAR